MAFIDIFNFKKYFRKPSDAQVARYGHVNALYDDLTNSLSIQTAEYTLPPPITQGKILAITTKAGIINIEKTLNPGEYYTFKISHLDITPNSVVLVNASDSVLGDSLLHCSVFLTGSSNNNKAIVITNINPSTVVDNFSVSYYIIG